MARRTKLNFRVLERSTGARMWSRSVLRMGAKRILLQHAVGPMSKREGKNETVVSPHHVKGTVPGAYTFSHVIPITLILLLTTWSTQMHTPGSKGHEKKTSVMLGEARGENTNSVHSLCEPPNKQRKSPCSWMPTKGVKLWRKASAYLWGWGPCHW